jgi:hypothetical protein
MNGAERRERIAREEIVSRVARIRAGVARTWRECMRRKAAAGTGAKNHRTDGTDRTDVTNGN